MSVSTIRDNGMPLCQQFASSLSDSGSKSLLPNLPNKINEFVIPFLHGLSAFSGVALGVLTGIAVTAGLASPVGLIITGSVIVIALTASFACGGKRQLLVNLACAVWGFGGGFFVGGIGGALQVEHGAVLAGKAAGLTGDALRASVNAATHSITWVIPASIFTFVLTPFVGMGTLSLAEGE